ncbi:MAG: Omp28 family outer membrane lipoprotein [Bacteroidales bacterium]|nr:Omp28 family outer membrane lipoprotein [Bacteroidales bacterium]
MKKTFLFIAIVLAFVACNKIEGPYLTQSQQENVDVVFPELDHGTVYRKILFDEYTGHHCPNCPEGHNKLNQLLTQYGDTLVAVGIHAGYFAEPDGGGLFTYDFGTETGEQLYADFLISDNPSAIINRSGVIENNVDLWPIKLQNADRSLHAAIQIINQFDNSHNKLKINTKTTILENLSQSVLLSLLLVEDQIVKPQENNGHVEEQYVHNHVLRAGINGTYGEYISPNGLVSKDSAYLYGYSIDFSGHDWVPENCSVIAILLDGNSKEVLQVEKSKVKN